MIAYADIFDFITYPGLQGETAKGESAFEGKNIRGFGFA